MYSFAPRTLKAFNIEDMLWCLWLNGNIELKLPTLSEIFHKYWINCHRIELTKQPKWNESIFVQIEHGLFHFQFGWNVCHILLRIAICSTCSTWKNAVFCELLCRTLIWMPWDNNRFKWILHTWNWKNSTKPKQIHSSKGTKNLYTKWINARRFQFENIW